MRTKQRRAHLLIWQMLAAVLAVLLLAAIGLRQSIPGAVPPIRLSAATSLPR